MMTGAYVRQGKRNGDGMSEPATEPAAPRSTGNVLLRKLGPLPVWAWMGIGLAAALAYWYWKSHMSSAGQTATTGQSTTSGSTIPQFVNQTYVQNTPPGDNDDDDKQKHPEQLTRTWQASATASTLAQVGARLGVTDPSKNLHPINKLALDFMHKTYLKNHNAKIPKGALFSYTEGTVTDKVTGKTVTLWPGPISR